MELVCAHNWSGRPERRLSVAEVVEAICEDGGFDSGAVERVGRQKRATAGLLGRLGDEIHKAGVIDTPALLRVLGQAYVEAS